MSRVSSRSISTEWPASSQAARLHRRAPWLNKLLRVLTMGGGGQNFIGGQAVQMAFRLAPASAQHPLALRVAGISPHYFSRQWSYPAGMRRSAVLQAEHERMIKSRQTIAENILVRYLKPNMTVLDFGCGPGYLAARAAALAYRVYGADISTGALSCAQRLNPAANLQYLHVSQIDSVIPAGSCDLIFCFAVFQHLARVQIAHSLKEFHRLLRPLSGVALCHLHLSDDRTPEQIARATSNADGSSAFALRFEYFGSGELQRMAIEAGFSNPEIVSIRERFGLELDDDICDGQMLILHMGKQEGVQPGPTLASGSERRSGVIGGDDYH